MVQQAVKLASVALLGGLFCVSQPAAAQTFNGSVLQGSNLEKAQAIFSFVGTTELDVTLKNTSTFSSYSNPDLLSGLFFGISGASNVTLTPIAGSARAVAIDNASTCTASMVTTCQGTNVNVGDEWGFQKSATGFTAPTLTTTGQFGLAAAGFSSMTPGFGSSTIFDPTAPNLTGHTFPAGGLDFSLVGSNYNAATSTNSVSGNPLIATSVTFRFGISGVPGGTTLAINTVKFAYGTAPDGSSSAPEPLSMAVFGTALAGLAVVRVRSRREARVAH